MITKQASEQRYKGGIPLPDTIWQSIIGTAASVGIHDLD